MKKLIYQVYIGKRSNLYDWCTESVEKYCKKYEIDHIIQKDYLLNIQPNPKRSNRSGKTSLPIFEKENAFRYLNEYDKIMILDSDIYVRENSPNIFEDFEDNFEFGACVERDMPIKKNHKNGLRMYSKNQYEKLKDVDWKWNDAGAEFMNMGMMIFNSSLSKYLQDNDPKEFIQRKEFEDFVDGVGKYKNSTDQTLLNYWLKKENVKVKKMDWKWNAMYKAIEISKLKEAYFIHFYNRNSIPQKGENIKDLMKEIE